MSYACCILHEWANELPRFKHDFLIDALPRNGICLIFEKGEQAHNVNRIVQVGTHTGQNNLDQRICEHFHTANKDRSILRKHIGRCLLANSPFLNHWNLDLTTKANRDKYKNIVNFKKQKEVEEEVTKYISDYLSFAVFKVEDKSERLFVKEALLSTINVCEKCIPSKNWLGLKHKSPQIQKGLWNIQGVNKNSLSEDEMKYLIEKST